MAVHYQFLPAHETWSLQTDYILIFVERRSVLQNKDIKHIQNLFLKNVDNCTWVYNFSD